MTGIPNNQFWLFYSIRTVCFFSATVLIMCFRFSSYVHRWQRINFCFFVFKINYYLKRCQGEVIILVKWPLQIRGNLGNPCLVNCYIVADQDPRIMYFLQVCPVVSNLCSLCKFCHLETMYLYIVL